MSLNLWTCYKNVIILHQFFFSFCILLELMNCKMLLPSLNEPYILQNWRPVIRATFICKRVKTNKAFFRRWHRMHDICWGDFIYIFLEAATLSLCWEVGTTHCSTASASFFVFFFLIIGFSKVFLYLFNRYKDVATLNQRDKDNSTEEFWITFTS